MKHSLTRNIASHKTKTHTKGHVVFYKKPSITFPEFENGNRDSSTRGETSFFGSSRKQVKSWNEKMWRGDVWRKTSRVTHVVIFILIGLSAFMSPILAKIPMPVLFFQKHFWWKLRHCQVLYGVFLYMGINSLDGIQMWEQKAKSNTDVATYSAISRWDGCIDVSGWYEV